MPLSMKMSKKDMIVKYDVLERYIENIEDLKNIIKELKEEVNEITMNYEGNEKYTDTDKFCDCCMGGYGISNEFGRCHCWCSKCEKLMSDCRYTCN